MVCAKFAHTTPHGAIKGKTQKQEVTFYNLDVIISVGYRVHSQRGVSFRQWATRILKQYLMKGYAVKDKIKQENYESLKQLVSVMGRSLFEKKDLSLDGTRDLVNVVVDYNTALDRLDDYDYQRLSIHDTTPEESFHATYDKLLLP